MGSGSSKILSYSEARNRCTPEEYKRFRNGFDKICIKSVVKVQKPNGRGVQIIKTPRVEKSAFVNDVLGGRIPPQIADRFFQIFDQSKNGFIDWKDFFCGLAIFSRGTPNEKAKFLFYIYDKSGNGKVKREDMEAILREDIARDQVASSSIDEILDDCFINYDKDGDGLLSFDELMNWASEHKDMTGLLSWVFNGKFGASIKTEPTPEEEPPTPENSLLTSQEIMRNDINSSKNLSSFTNFDDREVKDLEKVFKEVVKSSSLDKMDMETLGIMFEPPLPYFILDRLFSAFDHNQDGFIDGREFICGLSVLARSPEDKKMKFWFRLFDIDNDQSLSRDEMLIMVKSLWTMHQVKVTLDSVKPSRSSSSSSDDGNSLRASSNSVDEEERMEILVKSAYEEFGLKDGDNISFDQFRVWFSTAPIALQFHEAIKRMANVVVGIKPSNPIEEGQTIKKLMNELAPMVEKEKVYVLSATWWEHWKEYVGFDNESFSEADVPTSSAAASGVSMGQMNAPGPIDNSKIIAKKTKNELLSNLVEQNDFVLLRNRVWNVLWNWYGGGPVLERTVIKDGEGMSMRLKAELYPISFRVQMRRYKDLSIPTKTIDCSMSKNSLIASLIPIIAPHFHLTRDEQKKLRFWNFYDVSKPLVLDDLDISFDEAQIVNGQRIVVELQDDNGTWPLQDVYVEDRAASSAKEKGIVGLNNLGNTCFMNSALQCLTKIPPLTEYFLQDHFRKEINKTNNLGTRGEVAKSFAELLKRMWVPDPKHGRIPSTLAPHSFKRTIGRFYPQFSGREQHDSQEFLAQLLDGMHEDLNRVKVKPYVSSPEGDKDTSDETLGEMYWDWYQLRNKSIITDLFQGQLKSTVHCTDCSYRSVSFDAFSCLSLPLPPDTMRLFRITVVTLDPLQVPVTYGIVISSENLAVDLKTRLSSLCGINAKQLVLAEVQRHYFFRLLSNLTRVSSIHSDYIFAFQVQGLQATRSIFASSSSSSSSSASSSSAAPTSSSSSSSSSSSASSSSSSSPSGSSSSVPVAGAPEDKTTASSKREKKKKYMYVPVVMRYIEKQANYFLYPFKARLFGTPLLLSFDIEHPPTLDELYETAIKQMGPAFKSAVHQESHSTEKYPFVFKIVNRNGEACPRCSWHLYCQGCSLLASDILDVHHRGWTIAMDWDPKSVSRFVDRKRFKLAVEHESIKSLEEAKQTPILLKDSFQLFTKEEMLGEDQAWRCRSCEDFKPATKQLELWKLPSVVIIHLKRFEFSLDSSSKINRPVQYPLTDLNLAQYSSNNLLTESNYNLVGVVNHFGSLVRGHYTAFVNKEGKWYCCDDSTVTEVDASVVQSPNAYFLFYAIDKDISVESIMQKAAASISSSSPPSSGSSSSSSSSSESHCVIS